jgi:dihydropteroate synthase
MASTANLAGIKVGDGQPVRIMGVINVSPESFYKGSVEDRKTIQKAAREAEEQGADILDIGAMSTAPYLENQVSEKVEAERLVWAVKAARAGTKIPISIDTSRPIPTSEGLRAGADILNDITSLSGGGPMFAAAREAKGLVMMAHPSLLNGSEPSNPAQTIKRILEESLQRARDAGIESGAIVIDPGIGFFRNTRLEWWRWDLAVLRDLAEIAALPAPVMVGVSRKSFISQILDGRTPEHRLYGSLGATVAAVVNGATMVRTHDIVATKEAVRVAQAIMVERIAFRTTAPVERAPKGRKRAKAKA